MSDLQSNGYPRVFANIARDLLAQESVQNVLDGIVELAVKTIDGCEEAGVLLIDRRRRTYETPASTGELVQESDRAQHECNEGPCLDAARYGRSFHVDDMAQETRWPSYRPRALELGIRSILGFELFTHDGVLGALDLYSRTPNTFDDRSREIGWVFASHAAVAIAGARREDTLRHGYATRQEIGEAVGILMERYKLTSQQAFDVLKKASMESNTKLRDVARHVGQTGEIPSDD